MIFDKDARWRGTGLRTRSLRRLRLLWNGFGCQEGLARGRLAQSAAAHCLEGSFYSDSSDVDVTQHCSYEEYGNNRGDDFSNLHTVNVRSIEWEHQDIAADR